MHAVRSFARCLATVLLGVCALTVPLHARAQAPVAAQADAASADKGLAYESDPKFQDTWKKAQKYRGEQDYSGAAGVFKKANEIAGGHCERCLRQAYACEMKAGKFKDAAAFAQQLASIASAPKVKSTAESDQATALMKQAGDKPKPEQLAAIDALFQAALADNERNIDAHWGEGCVLAREGKNDEASRQFTACADRMEARQPAMAVRARHFAENPALALNRMAPAFEVTALDGTSFNLDDMAGKVVLIDFWATWCGPCNAELPHLRDIARQFAGQPLVMISISIDKRLDDEKWKQFVASHGMTWLQYHDSDGQLQRAFDVSSIPHYFTIDSDGVLTTEVIGAGSGSEGLDGKLKKMLKRAHESKPQGNQAAVGR